jgi:hypothetical protein
MVLDHERLDVYAVALDFLVFANEVIERFRAGEGFWRTSSREPRRRSC